MADICRGIFAELEDSAWFVVYHSLSGVVKSLGVGQNTELFVCVRPCDVRHVMLVSPSCHALRYGVPYWLASRICEMLYCGFFVRIACLLVVQPSRSVLQLFLLCFIW